MATALVIENDPTDDARRLGEWLTEAGLPLTVLRPHAGDELPETLDGYLALVVLGGDQNAFAAADGTPGAPWFPALEGLLRKAVRNRVPTLGVCLGGQLLASALGARVGRGRPELGLHDVFLTDAAGRDPLFAGLPARLPVLGWHEDGFDLPRGAVPLAGSIRCTYQAFRFGPAAYALQFHPEVRIDDLARWRHAAGYSDLASRTGTDFDRLAVALRRATPALDALAEQLLGRWLNLVAGVAALTSKHLAAA